jgi:undecaprenyl-diphosphatase
VLAAAGETAPAAAAAAEGATQAAAGIGFWEGAFLGLVQGATEFIPVSSSGHLVLGRLVRSWMGGAAYAPAAENLAFDVAVHAATLLAMLLYFRDDIVALFRKRPRVMGLVILGCVPAGIIGYFFKDWFHGITASAYVLGAAFMVNGLFLVGSKFFGIETKRLEDLRPSDSLLVGLAQAVALTPGISRSGITITSGLVCGLRRTEAFVFGFMVGMPVIAGATVYELKDIQQLTVSDSWSGLVAGFIVAFISGLVAVWILARLVRRRNLLPFGIYTLILGLAVIVCQAIWG